MSTSDLESMFDLYRFRSQQDFHKILLYFPFGFILLLLRLAVAIITFPVLALLPVTSQQRSYVLKAVCLAFGVNIKTDMQEQNENAKLLICNHISILDHIVVESVLSCKQINMCSHFSEWNFLSLLPQHQRELRNGNVDGHMNILQHCFDGAGLPVCVFPEGTTTNGRHALLRFDPMLFDTAVPVQPVVISISRTSFISISPSVLGSSSWCDMLWMLFVPYTEFSIRALPCMMKMEDESAESFSRRVQSNMASFLNILASAFTVTDKIAYKKHIAAGTISVNSVSHAGNQAQRSEAGKMAILVKEILPDVPISVILQDIVITKSVDATILRILEGKVSYVSESPPSGSASNEVLNLQMAQDDKPNQTLQKQAHLSLSTGVRSFGKTPKDRMLSYQERKAILIKSAKLRYLKKHGLIS